MAPLVRRAVHLKDGDHVAFEGLARAAQAQLKASDLGDAAFQALHRVGVFQELPCGLLGDKLTGKGQ